MPFSWPMASGFRDNPLSRNITTNTSPFAAPDIWVSLAESDRSYQEMQSALLMHAQLMQIYQQLAPGQTVMVGIEGINTESHASWMERSPLWESASSPRVVSITSDNGLPRLNSGVEILLHRPTDLHNDICRSPVLVNTTFRVTDGIGGAATFELDKTRLAIDEIPLAKSTSASAFDRPGAQPSRADTPKVTGRADQDERDQREFEKYEKEALERQAREERDRAIREQEQQQEEQKEQEEQSQDSGTAIRHI